MFRSVLGVLFSCLVLVIAAGFSPASAQTLYVEPASSQPEDVEFTVAIVLDTDGQSVMGMDVSLAFNEFLVQLDGIDPGPWFTALDPDYFFWDYTHTGTELIRFTGSSLGSAVTASGVVAVCRFTALAAGISPVTFLLTDLRDGQNAMLECGHSTGDKIIIDGAVPVGRYGLGQIKALFR